MKSYEPKVWLPNRVETLLTFTSSFLLQHRLGYNLRLILISHSKIVKDRRNTEADVGILLDSTYLGILMDRMDLDSLLSCLLFH